MAGREARLGPPRVGFVLGDWLAQPSADRLSRHGSDVHLRPKLMDLLVALATRPGQVVSKDELIDALWPRQFIGESALTRAIADLRRVLDADLHAPRAIETIPKRGYRLLLPVTDAPRGPATAGVASTESPPWPFAGPLPATTPDRVFVGRAPELARLNAALDRAARGHGRVVFVTGESGTGKTSLLGEFACRAGSRVQGDVVVAGARGQTISGPGEPFLLFRQIVTTLTGDVAPAVAAGAMTVQQANALWAFLPTAADLLLDVAPDIVDTFVPRAALDARVSARTRNAAGWYDAWRMRLDALPPRGGASAAPNLASQCVEWLRALAGTTPLILLLDDLHWADAASLDLLFRLTSDLDGLPLLAVGAYRPAELAPAADGSPHRHSSVLCELRRRHGDATIDLPETCDLSFVEALIDREPNALGRGFRNRLLERTSGHPLFTTELLRSMQDRGALVRDPDGQWVESGSLDWDAMPARMEAAVEARISRIRPDLRRVLDVASVEGEEFTAEILARVLDLDERRTVLSLGSDLDRGHALVTASAIAVNPIDGRRVSTYRFRHAAIQQYLLAHLDVVERRHLEAAVGGALEEVHAGHLPDVATKLAFHFEEGGVLAKAIEYLVLAAERATALAAQQEALFHLRRAGGLVERMPDVPLRDVLELSVRMATVTVLSQTRQESAAEIGPGIVRVMLLAQRAPDDRRVCTALVWLALLHGLQGNYVAAVRTAADCQARAERLGAVPFAAAARSLRGVFGLRGGDLRGARGHLEATAASASSVGDEAFSIAGMHPEVWRLTGLGYVLFFLGYPDQGLARMREAMTAAERDGTPASRVYAMGLSASLHIHRREPAAAEDLIHTSLQLLRGRVYSHSDILSTFILGWALVERGEALRGLELIESAVQQVRAGTLKVDWTKFLARLGEAQCHAGRAAEALVTLDEGLAAAAASGERYYEAELLRLRGDVLDALDRPGAEACYQQALDVARAQGAKAWELRVSTRLARSWLRAGRHADARDLLAGICGWHSEGHQTSDYTEATSLLESMATSGGA